MTPIKSLQSAWFVGHVATLLLSLTHLVSVLIVHANTFSYKAAYLSACFSYGIIVFKTHGMPKPTKHYVYELVADENVHYLILALVWLFHSPITVTLIPYTTYALFHTLSYLRTTLISNSRLQQQIKTWTNANYNAAMRFVAIIEVVAISLQVLLGIFSLRMVPAIVYLVFLRCRYLSSSFTRTAFHDIDVNLTPRVPPMLRKTYDGVRGLIIRFGTPQEDSKYNE